MASSAIDLPTYHVGTCSMQGVIRTLCKHVINIDTPIPRRNIQACRRLSISTYIPTYLLTHGALQHGMCSVRNKMEEVITTGQKLFSPIRAMAGAVAVEAHSRAGKRGGRNGCLTTDRSMSMSRTMDRRTRLEGLGILSSFDRRSPT